MPRPGVALAAGRQSAGGHRRQPRAKGWRSENAKTRTNQPTKPTKPTQANKQANKLTAETVATCFANGWPTGDFMDSI